MKLLETLDPLLEGASTLNIVKRVQDASRGSREVVNRLLDHLMGCFGDGVPGTVIGTSDGGAVGSLTLPGDLKVAVEVSGPKVILQVEGDSISLNLEEDGWEDRACQFVKEVIERRAIEQERLDLLYFEASRIDPGRYSPYLQSNTGFTKNRFLILTDRFGNLRVEAFVRCPPAIRITAKKPNYKEFFLDLLGNDFRVRDAYDTLLVTACDEETGLVSPEKLGEFIKRLRERLGELARLVKKNDLAYRY